MKKNLTMRLALGGLYAAVIALLTAYVRIPFPMQSGYAHLGDLGILLASLTLGPFAFLPAAIGSGLADVLAGFAAYAPFTLLVKGVMGYLLGLLIVRKEFAVRNFFVLLLNAAFMVGAYFLTDTVLYGWAGAVGSLVGNCVQGGALLVGGMVIIPLVCALPQSVQKRMGR